MHEREERGLPQAVVLTVERLDGPFVLKQMLDGRRHRRFAGEAVIVVEQARCLLPADEGGRLEEQTGREQIGSPRIEA